MSAGNTGDILAIRSLLDLACLVSLMSQILTPISFGKFRGRLIRAHSAFRITFPTREAREVSPTHAKLERKKMYLTP